MLGVSAGSTNWMMASSTAVGSCTPATLQQASMATAMPAMMKALPKMMAPPPKNFSRSSWPAAGIFESGLSGPRAASAARAAVWSVWAIPARFSTSSSRSSSGASDVDVAGEKVFIGAPLPADGGAASAEPIIGSGGGDQSPAAGLLDVGFLGLLFFFAIMIGEELVVETTLRWVSGANRGVATHAPAAHSIDRKAKMR